MQAPLREDCHTERYDIDPYSAHTILIDHPTRRVASYTNHCIVRALMEVRWQHTAGTELQERIADAKACHCWEDGGIGGNDRADGIVVVGVVEEVVVPVAVFGKKRVAIIICCRHFEHSVEVWIERLGAEGGGDKGEESGKEKDRSVHRALVDKNLGWESIEVNL